MATEVQDMGRKIQITPEGVTVTRELRVTPYQDWVLVADLLLGGVKLIGGFLYRFPPAYDPAVPWCYCQDITVDGYEYFSGTQPNGFQALADYNIYANGAKLTAVYKTMAVEQLQENNGSSPGQSTGVEPQEQQEIDLCEEAWDFSAQVRAVPLDKYKFLGDTVTAQDKLVAAQAMEPRVSYKLVRHFVPNIQQDAISRLCGKINEKPFVIRNRTWAPETVRFDGANVSRKVSSTGVKYFDITYQFVHNPSFGILDAGPGTGYAGWNRAFNFKTGRYEKPILVGDGTSNLFQLDKVVSQTIKGSPVLGFRLLFNPRAL